MLSADDAPLLTCRGIRLRRRRFVLDVECLSFGAGLTLVSGINGAGKSSLLSCIVAGADRRMRSIEWRGEMVVGREAVTQFRRQLGYLPQEVVLPWAWQVREYLLFAARARGLDSKRSEVAVTASCDVLAIDDTVQRRRIGALSGGWQRRVQLCQALVSDPDVVILDEPFSGLDYPAIEMLRDHFASIAVSRNRVVIVADHTTALADIPHHAITVAQGKVL